MKVFRSWPSRLQLFGIFGLLAAAACSPLLGFDRDYYIDGGAGLVDGGAGLVDGGTGLSDGGAGLSDGGTGLGGGGAQAGEGGVALTELAHGKPSLASSVQTGNVASNGNDGNVSSRWCAKDGTYPQWWRVDLGAVVELSVFTIRFEHSDRKYSYLVETSQDDVDYTQQLSLSGTGSTLAGSFPTGVSARYVRFTVTAGAPDGADPTWACIREATISGP